MAERDTLTKLLQLFEACRPRLLRYLRAAFPRLANEAEDILQLAWLEVQQRAGRGDLPVPDYWEAWFRTLVRCRALDRLRAIERHVFWSWQQGTSNPDGSAKWEPSAGTQANPSQEVLERERRQRQGLLLSEVLEQFCRWCEKRPQRLAVKEAYERSLHGQSPAEIAAAMGVSCDSVYQWLHQAREWIRRRLGEKDVDRSVFLTLYGAKQRKS